MARIGENMKTLPALIIAMTVCSAHAYGAYHQGNPDAAPDAGGLSVRGLRLKNEDRGPSRIHAQSASICADPRQDFVGVENHSTDLRLTRSPSSLQVPGRLSSARFLPKPA